MSSRVPNTHKKKKARRSEKAQRKVDGKASRWVQKHNVHQQSDTQANLGPGGIQGGQRRNEKGAKQPPG